MMFEFRSMSNVKEFISTTFKNVTNVSGTNKYDLSHRVISVNC